MRWLAVAVLLGGCHMLFGLQEVKPDASGSQTWLAGYTYRKPITMRLGALDNFVASVTADDVDLAMHARSDGRDIVFTDADGLTLLDFELVAYAGGTLEAWVMVPTLTAPATTIYVYYGGPMTPPTPPPWTILEHAGVWHLAEQGATELDSTIYGHNVTAAADEAPAPTKGIAGAARLFDGVNDSMCGEGDTSLNQGAGSFGMAAWVHVTASAGPYDQPVFKGGNSAGVPGYSLELGTGDWAASVADGDTTLVSFGFMQETPNNWVYLAVFVDRNDSQTESDDVIRAYVNGVLLTSQPVTGLGSVDGPSPFCLGGPDSYPFRGILEEVRVYKRVLNARKIAAEYTNLAERATAIQIGAEEK